MANYDNKLGEWFKQVEKKAHELAAKKKAVETGYEPPVPLRTEAQPRPIEVEAPTREMAPVTRAADVAVAERTDSETGVPRPAEDTRTHAPVLFDDAEVPPVEDFFSFLSHSSERADEQEPMDEPPFDVPKDQGTLILSEGTGVPRPIAAPEPKPEPTVMALAAQPPAPQARVQAPQVSAPPIEARKPEPAAVQAVVAEQPTTPSPKSVVSPEPVAVISSDDAHAATVEEKWERLPQHLRILFEGDVAEIAQHSYKTFKETRTGLIQRLLDPTVSLEDAARILNVCPTTVRRYTNRGALKHYRTAGNQRRFRLSDVLAFMETGMPRQKSA